MSKWQEDPELFLYKGHKKGNALHLWRCEPISSSMPLRREDFTDEIPVPGFKYLVRKGFPWNQSHLKALEEYIAPRHFLVNCQGLIYVELHKSGVEEEIDDGERIYLRLHDVLNMESYGLNTSKVPFRTLGYLEEGAAAKVDPSPNEVKLSSDMISLFSEVEMLKKELEKEKRDKQAVERKVADSEATNIALKNKESQLTADLHTHKKQIADLEADRMRLISDMAAQKCEDETRQQDLKNKVDQLEADKAKMNANLTALNCEVATLRRDLSTAKGAATAVEPWMNSHSNPDWIGVESFGPTDFVLRNLTKAKLLEDKTTNVRSEYFYVGMFNNFSDSYKDTIVKLDDLIPNKEKARFGRDWWLCKDAAGNQYVGRNNVNLASGLEHWMNGYNNLDWIPVEQFGPQSFSLRSVTRAKLLEDKTTNVKPEFFYVGMFHGFSDAYKDTIIKLDDLIPNKEKARFSRNWWLCKDAAGNQYVGRNGINLSN